MRGAWLQNQVTQSDLLGHHKRGQLMVRSGVTHSLLFKSVSASSFPSVAFGVYPSKLMLHSFLLLHATLHKTDYINIASVSPGSRDQEMKTFEKPELSE